VTKGREGRRELDERKGQGFNLKDFAQRRGSGASWNHAHARPHFEQVGSQATGSAKPNVRDKLCMVMPKVKQPQNRCACIVCRVHISPLLSPLHDENDIYDSGILQSHQSHQGVLSE